MIASHARAIRNREAPEPRCRTAPSPAHTQFPGLVLVCSTPPAGVCQFALPTPTGDPADSRCSLTSASPASVAASAPATETVSSPDKISVTVSRVIRSQDNTSSRSASA